MQRDAKEIVAAMGMGWNLGNTFDSYHRVSSQRDGAGYAIGEDVTRLETMWLSGSGDATTLTLIKRLKELGFETIRIPVTWHRVADPDNNWTIWTPYMDRVHEVVKMAYDEGMYVVLNVHHDDYVMRYSSGPARNVSETAGQINAVDRAQTELVHRRFWEQISTRFAAFGERLIFEGLNEPRTIDSPAEWTGGTSHEREFINELNQLFVDTVRATGGNNKWRTLMLPTYAASAALNPLRTFEKPEDEVENRLALSLHAYSPFSWAHDGWGAYAGWKSALEADFNRIQTRAGNLNMPVVLGEWGSVNNINNVDNTSAAQRATHARDYVFMAVSRGMAPIWWDNANQLGRNEQHPISTHGFGLIARAAPHNPFYAEIVTGMSDGLALARSGGQLPG